MRAFVILLVLLSASPAVASDAVPLKNWPVAFDSLLAERNVQATRPFRFETNAVPSAASHFIATTPCRVRDTRNTGSPLPANSTTAVDVVGSGCGIPPGAAAYSMNFTAMNPADNGYLTAYPTGSARPTTATLSYLLNGPAFDNAAIVPAGTGGAIDVYVAASLHLILDINGYFVEGVVTGLTTSDGLSGGGTGGVTLGITDGGIADTKLATIATAGKVANSATTATGANVAGAIVARDGSGGFAAGALTLSGKVDQTSVDGLVSNGAAGSGTIPATGAGTRLMWYPGKAAFRAGGVVGTHWDDASIGPYSTAIGRNTTANGDFSVATGLGTTASGGNSTAMGYNTTASGFTSTAMGVHTTASSSSSTAMGNQTTASGFASTATGVYTTASGQHSTAMGYTTTASGNNSTAMGYHASTTDAGGTARYGTFVWGDASTISLVRPTADNQFVARASGGVTFFSNSATSTGVSLTAGGGSWASVSDRASKTDFDAVDGDTILNRLATLPVESWQYRDDASGRRYIGPVAQDFHAAFGLGDDKTIATLDVDGVTLAAVKALEQRTRDLQTENAALRDQLMLRDQAQEQLLRRLERLESELPSARP